MKYTSLLLITLTALAFTGCTLFPNTQTTPPIIPPTSTPSVIVINDSTVVTPATPEDITKTPATPNETIPVKTTTTPVDKDIPKITVSTEELTKELDSFVDDITKGL